MTTELKKYFPMLREREEILAEIGKRENLRTEFESWEPEQREEFLDVCSGVKGMKFLYDGFFKEILNPEYVPERFNDFLSCMLCQKARVLKILPNDSTRIASESSLLITDIVVELADGSIANVEMQKIGYLFPEQRCACYSADLLLRQYRRVRGERKKTFGYRDIRNVYTIVLFEKSPAEFHRYPERYYHMFEQKSDTGLKLELLQKYVFIPLDIFRENQQNKSIEKKLDAWLTLLSCEEPEKIIELIEKYPEFREIYEEGSEICQNTERVMEMFSKELYELDKNTVQYMIDEMQDTIDAQKQEIDKQNTIINKMKKEQDEMIRGTVNILRNMNAPEEEIVERLCAQYGMDEEKGRSYL